MPTSDKRVDPPNSRDIIVATITKHSGSQRPDWLADWIIKDLAAEHMHIMKYKGSEL